MDYQITVNGTSRTVSATPDTPLLYVLINQLDLKGPRFGCGLAQCGSCSVRWMVSKSAPASLRSLLFKARR
jgi:aerobic-type carbon monoxide dehydrogenase small subunit (CoxS/CutS family)